MSFTIISGPPASGKTSRLLYLAETLDRPLLHNIDGLQKGDHILHDAPLSFRDVSDYFRIETYDKNSLYHNAVFLLDEFSLFYRYYLRGHEDEINKFFENYCSYNIDFYIAVQNIRFFPRILFPEFFLHDVFTPTFLRRYFARKVGCFSSELYACRFAHGSFQHILKKRFSYSKLRYPAESPIYKIGD